MADSSRLTAPVAMGGSGDMDDIPDMDENDTAQTGASSSAPGLDASNTEMERLTISDDDIPDMDEIPDMDDEGVATMEEEGDEAEAILVRPTA
jgi:ubiquitin-like-conjugating enzyme ATG3